MASHLEITKDAKNAFRSSQSEVGLLVFPFELRFSKTTPYALRLHSSFFVSS